MMMSGNRSRASWIASSAVAPWPTISMSGCALRVWMTPSRNSGWSSMMITLILSLIADFHCLEGQAGDDFGAPPWFALDSEPPAQTLDPFAHPDQAQVLI